ncbi:leucyl aminopeptidase [Campylobacter canadensis]|uniref:leucyl aminopeptidase n=1 Tax=Campylobacter canadensis TaxID=449520 RepID=UPI0015538D7A|nr:leucyl aminopeptidase [Campylobacter canadensis]MBZ7994703.1 leucyl aminopeptidase [Campylobacter canadensis]MBZ7996199.1 leucyl aminopeptidase [Campylobacter canadensis]MBZ7999985.1 leucyl aminopeptidase [Campylobacter canadensis]MBZ8001630.1 leucyl aminopeptidase [Campylobacter canadensis]MBZ8003276.1 leucyl aminopeptidase [Campylobacter canadensis]
MKVEFNKKADFEIIFLNDEIKKEKKDFFKLMQYEHKGTCLDIANSKLYLALSPKLTYAALTSTIAQAIKQIRYLNIKSVKIDYINIDCHFNSVYSIIYGAISALYEFNKYQKEKKKINIEKIILNTQEDEDKKEGANLALILADSSAYVKDIVNEIPSTYTQESFEEDAKKLAKENNLELKVYKDDYLKKENMNAFLAVNRASAYEARLIHLTYKPKKALKKIVYVGKGLVYDTGGLSLKPADYMLTMKSDKSGAAAVLGIIKAASQLKLPFEIHAIIGAAQNCISEKAYMPDDVIISREGVSIEVRNTDAEGRLVLADCLSYAQDLKPDYLIDLATLTGACVVGLGEYTSAIMGYNEDLQNEFYAHSKRSGEYACILHFNPHLASLIKSKIADISNTSSSRYGGAITAGLFLGEFIKEEYKDKWLHLDIAGPAYVEKDWGENSYGAGAAGLRMCIIDLLNIKRKMEKK